MKKVSIIFGCTGCALAACAVIRMLGGLQTYIRTDKQFILCLFGGIALTMFGQWLLHLRPYRAKQLPGWQNISGLELLAEAERRRKVQRNSALYAWSLSAVIVILILIFI